ncbi:hypothetical protein BJY00DRAFT_296624 [Aspergillus carlsbadensis]|nr:hypothetical protein BJY00DRAFT_296624 [Aspergillus carlsbadensis]
MDNTHRKTKTQPQSSRLPIAKHKANSDPRYHILQTRSASTSHPFLYGVRSTNVYCLPTCTARLARRANVVFFNTAQEARRDGFRPCKRCRPDEGGFRGKAEEVVARVIALATRRGSGEVIAGVEAGSGAKGVIGLAREVGVSPSYLSRIFKRVMGVTVREYLIEFERGGLEPIDMASNGTMPEDSPVSSVGSGDILEASDFADFDLDDWFWTGEYLHGTGEVQTL